MCGCDCDIGCCAERRGEMSNARRRYNFRIYILWWLKTCTCIIIIIGSYSTQSLSRADCALLLSQYGNVRSIRFGWFPFIPFPWQKLPRIKFIGTASFLRRPTSMGSFGAIRCKFIINIDFVIQNQATWFYWFFRGQKLLHPVHASYFRTERLLHQLSALMRTTALLEKIQIQLFFVA